MVPYLWEMNSVKRNEELLREASAFGDKDAVHALVEIGSNINAQHNLNGWTALHWAAKRGHSSIVQYLLSKGADPTLKSLYGESAFAVAKNDEIRDLLSEYRDTCETQITSTLPITPNYLANPPLSAEIPVQEYKTFQSSNPTANITNKNMQCLEEELVLKIRSSDPPDQDFIEIEIPLKNLTYENVLKISCDELKILPQNVSKVRKLPNTIMRKDKDIQRLQNFQELELVMVRSQNYSMNSAARLDVNGHIRNNSDDTNSLVSKSNYCKNGIMLY